MKSTLKVIGMIATLTLVTSTVHARPAQDDRGTRQSESQTQGNGVNVSSQLMITDLSVVEDPLRTDPRYGDYAVWSFRYLMEQMAGDQDPSDFVLQWLEQWATDQTINGHTVAAREAIREKVIAPWLQASGGAHLDLSIAPFKLLAIVNRMDLRNHTANGKVSSAGQGRFVFGVLDQNGQPLPPLAGSAASGFTVILEYELVANNMQGLRYWTQAWRKLGEYELGTESYNAALEVITRKFSDRDDTLERTNGSPLSQIRTNEIALDTTWELREFVLDSESGYPRQHTVALSPDPISLNGTPEFADLINANEASLLRGDFELESEWFGGASLAGPFTPEHFIDWYSRSFVTEDIFEGQFFDVPWSASGINSNEARHQFALNTCNGCHRDETGTDFLQISFSADHTLPGSMGVEAVLSSYLTGTQITDPVDGVTIRDFAELSVRAADFAELVESFETRNGGQGPRKEHKPRFVH